jgi:hypothetical protein
VITLVQLFEAYCEANDSSPVVATLGLDSENDVVCGEMAIAMFENADFKDVTMCAASFASK